MEAQIIPFPIGLGQPQAPRLAVGEGTAPEAAPRGQGSPVVLVALELRRLVHAGMRLSYGAEVALRKRCAVAGLRALAAAGGEVSLAGGDEWLLIEATFEGEGAMVAAAAAVLKADVAVRGTGGNGFIIAGAAAAGRAVREGPTTSMLGAPGALIGELVHKAAPGQVLLGGGEWAAERHVRMLPARELEFVSLTAPVFVLRATG